MFLTKKLPSNMSKYLIIVEGEKTEFELIKSALKVALPTYNVETTKFKGDDTAKFINTNKAEDIVFVIRPRLNRLSNIVNEIKRDNFDIFAFQMYFEDDIDPDYFEKIFFIYDVDYTTDVDLSFALDYFNDEYSNGLLIVSSPCIEAMSDFDNSTFFLPEGKRISKVYKPIVRPATISRYPCYLDKGYLCCLCDNAFAFFEACLNRNLLAYSNHQRFMEHELLFKESHLPKRVKNGIHYPFITSFIYILIGSILKIDKLDNSSNELLNYFKKHNIN